MVYKKICKICGIEFESESHNAVYCSDKCSKKGAKRAYRSRKMKHINAVRKGDDKEIEIAIQQSYKLARCIAKLLLHKKCSCTEQNHICDGDLVVHHIDHCIWNNSPSNLMWLCEKAHKEIHSNEEDCSILDEAKAYVTIRKQAEIRERNSAKRKDNSAV